MNALLHFTTACTRIQQFEIHKCQRLVEILSTIHVVVVNWLALLKINETCCKHQRSKTQRLVKKHKQTANLGLVMLQHRGCFMCTSCKCMNEALWGHLVDTWGITGMRSHAYEGVCIFSLRVLWLPLTIQKHAQLSNVNSRLLTYMNMSMCALVYASWASLSKTMFRWMCIWAPTSVP